MRFELASIESAGRKFAHEYAQDELDLEDERVRLHRPLHITGRVTQGEKKVKVEGHLTGEVEVDCDRCLKPIQLPLVTDFKLDYLTAADYQSLANAELLEDDLQVSVFDGEGIDIDEIAREQVLLNVPTHVLCEENCKGLCPVCGRDRNTAACACEQNQIDPRWEALKNLAKRN